MKLTMNLAEKSYDIIVGSGELENAHKYFNLQRKVLILTDSGVPEKYVHTVASQCKESVVVTIEAGEGSKSLESVEKICTEMLSHGFTRTDAALAVGGGVVGDLCGFVASCYQRGIDFYNIPTTLLSQLDSSIGGKTAVNLAGVKNCVGAFHQPKGVLIDPDTLKTLDSRQLSSGLAEAIKMSATSDAQLFSFIEENSIENNIEEIIYRSLLIKKSVVEKDERETGLRRVLNFGHTVGHAIESVTGMLHGECVALGMLYLCSKDTRERLVKVLSKAKLPIECNESIDTLAETMSHDKKCDGGNIRYIYVEQIGTFSERTSGFSDFVKMLKEKNGI